MLFKKHDRARRNGEGGEEGIGTNTVKRGEMREVHVRHLNINDSCWRRGMKLSSLCSVVCAVIVVVIVAVIVVVTAGL